LTKERPAREVVRILGRQKKHVKRLPVSATNKLFDRNGHQTDGMARGDTQDAFRAILYLAKVGAKGGQANLRQGRCREAHEHLSALLPPF